MDDTERDFKTSFKDLFCIKTDVKNLTFCNYCMCTISFLFQKYSAIIVNILVVISSTVVNCRDNATK